MDKKYICYVYPSPFDDGTMWADLVVSTNERLDRFVADGTLESVEAFIKRNGFVVTYEYTYDPEEY